MSPVAFTWSSVPIHVIDFEGSARTGVVEFGVATLVFLLVHGVLGCVVSMHG